MGTIETTFYLDKNLTVFKAQGKLIRNDFKEWRTNYYAGTVTSLHLWDLYDADLSEITADLIQLDTQRTKQIAGMRAGGKTAFVADKDLAFGLSRMREIYSEIEELQIEYRTFHNIAEAKEWLGV